MNKKQDEWDIDALPFIWGTQDEPRNKGGLSDFLPFNLTFDKRTGLLTQKPQEVVEKSLSIAYELGSVLGSNVDEDGQGRRYADDFLEFIDGALVNIEPDKCHVLEIGCGNGYLMSRLVGRVASVVGIEPGPQGQLGADRFGLNIVRGFFPEALEKRKFSLIILNSVLEHIQDPAGMMRMVLQYLESGGVAVISVPDESAYVLTNDVSTLFHEHWSFFDDTTLKNVMAIAGMRVLNCQKSGFGASIYASVAASDASHPEALQGVDDAIKLARCYIHKARDNCIILGAECQKMMAKRNTLGIYVPARFVNAMVISKMSSLGIRFFDDDPALVGTYYPGIPIMIESGSALLENPTDSILIMSRTFGPQLAERLRSQLPDRVSVMTVANILDQ
jgi:2-polyprenyl-3-methyl-5-hydroxy-6-metoxy-1,4-benzoquinol methylase